MALLSRRGLPFLSLPSLGQEASRQRLRFIPHNDLVVTDPHLTPAYVTRNHGYLVFDTLFGHDDGFAPHPQMLDRYSLSADGLEWRLVLRQGLIFHDEEPVRARDAVASIRRWAKRDSFGEALLAATAELDAPDDATIRFRLQYRFPRLPDALGKSASFMPAIMPERLALTDPARPIPEVIGSGPYRFLSSEHVPGARAAYARFDAYVPRDDGPAERLAGPKLAHFGRIEWTTIRDPATAGAALARGEQDWWEYAANDLGPWLTRQRGIEVTVPEETGMVSMMQPNHLHPPFDNPDFRRALLSALDQHSVMHAIGGGDPAMHRLPLGVFTPGTPMASEAGLEPLAGARELARARRVLEASGMLGRRVVILSPGDFATGPLVGQWVAALMRAVGLEPDLQIMDQGALLRRRTNRATPEAGGWNLFTTAWSGLDWLDPSGHLPLRGDGRSYPGWARSEAREQLRDAWFAANTAAEQRLAAVALQEQAMRDVPFFPLGAYVQRSAHRSGLTGMRRGFPVFWGVRWA